jgi:hypothetical protein
MKKTRLLEIIREEIAGALREDEAAEKAAKDAQVKATDLEIKALQKKKAELMKTGVAEVALEEDQLNEMAYDIIIAQPNELAKLQDKIKDSTKKGEIKLAKALEIIQKTKKEGKPIRQRDIANEMGVIQQEVNPLINKLIDVGILEKGESVTGVTKKTVTDKPQGRPSNPNKPEKPSSTGKKGRPAGEPKTKVATRTKGDDGFDTVEYSDVEDEDVFDTETAPAGDKEVEKAARNRDELIKQYKTEVEPELKDKIAKAKSGDTEAMSWLKSKQDIIKKYNQAKQVNA